MGAVDCAEWAAPELELAFGGRTYMVRPPTVAASRQLLAAAVRGEVRLGLVKGEVPDDLLPILDSIGDSHPALGEVYDQLAADGVPQVTIDRMSYYATFYWTRGREYADALANILWAPAPSVGGEGEAPKGS